MSEQTDPLGEFKKASEVAPQPTDIFLSDRLSRVVLDKVRINLREYIGRDTYENLSVGVVDDVLTQRLVVLLRSYVLGNTIHNETTTTEVPLTWWDHFKDAHYPRWLWRRFPPKFRSIPIETKFVHLCPHSNMGPFRGPHLEFLMSPEQLRRMWE